MDYKDIIVVGVITSLFSFVLVLMYFGLKYFIQKIHNFREASQYRENSEREIAEYKAQVAELKMKVKATEVVAS